MWRSVKEAGMCTVEYQAGKGNLAWFKFFLIRVVCRRCVSPQTRPWITMIACEETFSKLFPGFSHSCHIIKSGQ